MGPMQVPLPKVREEQRLLTIHIPLNGFHQVIARYGYPPPRADLLPTPPTPSSASTTHEADMVVNPLLLPPIPRIADTNSTPTSCGQGLGFTPTSPPLLLAGSAQSVCH